MAAQQASKAMANMRTILVKVSPAPATLSERRAILRILKQRGEVELFKKLHVRFPGLSPILPEMLTTRILGPLALHLHGRKPADGP